MSACQKTQIIFILLANTFQNNLHLISASNHILFFAAFITLFYWTGREWKA
jgi:hypothetical protein